jgi:hypothetical protein
VRCLLTWSAAGSELPHELPTLLLAGHACAGKRLYRAGLHWPVVLQGHRATRYLLPDWNYYRGLLGVWKLSHSAIFETTGDRDAGINLARSAPMNVPCNSPSSLCTQEVPNSPYFPSEPKKRPRGLMFTQRLSIQVNHAGPWCG